MRGVAVAGCLALSVGVAGCAPAPDPASDGELRVVATTGILADLVRNVAGNRVHVTQMVPDGADPHSWEPSLRTVRDVAYADVAFSNYLMLEEHALIRALDSNLPAGSRSVSVAEEAAKTARPSSPSSKTAPSIPPGSACACGATEPTWEPPAPRRST